MKKWEAPVIESVDVANTAWEIRDGEVEDGMYVYCETLYES